MKLFILLAVIGIVASFDSSLDSTWENFKTTHGKVYKSHVEHNFRRQNWENSIKKVQQHNLEYTQGLHTFNMSINKYSDMNSTEFVQTMNGYKPTTKAATAETTYNPLSPKFKLPSYTITTTVCAANTELAYISASNAINYTISSGSTQFAVSSLGLITIYTALSTGWYSITVTAISSSGATISVIIQIDAICSGGVPTTTLAPALSTTTSHVATTTIHVTTTTAHVTATTTASTIPASVNWVTKGYVTAVKDQGQCGSCWSFSTTGALEGQHFKKTGTLVSLSEQQLVDCNYNCASNNCGCNGGAQEYAFQYIVNNKGIDTEASYPYTARDPSNGDTCKYVAANLGATVASNNTYSWGYVSVTKGNEMALMSAVATIGPISVAIDASDPSFQTYSSGVYGPSTCSSSSLDHAVLVVGYGHDTTTNLDYWLVKNSWSTSWGIGGYFWLARNQKNKCGVATDALYPLV